MQGLQQIKRGKEDTITVLTSDIIEKIPKVKLFHNNEMDLKSFADYASIYAMTAVCNDGTIYSIHKTAEFDPIALMVYYNIGIQKDGEYSGIKNVAKNASKIGIGYKCSIKRQNDGSNLNYARKTNTF